MKAYRIRNWENLFENHESRKLRSLTWLPVPNKHDGRGYRRVVALPNSVQVFCGWALMLQVASKMPTRGVLADDDGALTALDLSDKTGYPEAIFEAAFAALIVPKIGWLEEIEWPPDLPIGAETGRPSRDPPELPASREGKGRTKHGTDVQGLGDVLTWDVSNIKRGTSRRLKNDAGEDECRVAVQALCGLSDYDRFWAKARYNEVFAEYRPALIGAFNYVVSGIQDGVKIKKAIGAALWDQYQRERAELMLGKRTK